MSANAPKFEPISPFPEPLLPEGWTVKMMTREEIERRFGSPNQLATNAFGKHSYR